MLDVRSFTVYGPNCDMLGEQQWQWLEAQLDDPTPVALTLVTSGIQVQISILCFTICVLRKWLEPGWD